MSSCKRIPNIRRVARNLELWGAVTGVWSLQPPVTSVPAVGSGGQIPQSPEAGGKTPSRPRHGGLEAEPPVLENFDSLILDFENFDSLILKFTG